MKVRWASFASDEDAHYDDVVDFDASDIEPTVTWGVTPAQAIGVGERIPTADTGSELDQELVTSALDYMKLRADAPIKGTPIQVAFIGSCTNGRLSDFEAVAEVIKGHQVASHVRAIAVPGSEKVDAAARALGLHEVFEAAGFEVAISADQAGRIIDRLVRPKYNAALTFLDEGLATAGDMDLTCRLGLGYSNGPIERLEQGGLAHHFDVTKALFEVYGTPAYAPGRRATVAKQRRSRE